VVIQQVVVLEVSMQMLTHIVVTVQIAQPVVVLIKMEFFTIQHLAYPMVEVGNLVVLAQVVMHSMVVLHFLAMVELVVEVVVTHTQHKAELVMVVVVKLE
jgi:hypothetical protein